MRFEMVTQWMQWMQWRRLGHERCANSYNLWRHCRNKVILWYCVAITTQYHILIALMPIGPYHATAQKQDCVIAFAPAIRTPARHQGLPGRHWLQQNVNPTIPMTVSTIFTLTTMC